MGFGPAQGGSGGGGSVSGSSRVLYLDDFTSATRPTGATTVGSPAWSSTYNAFVVGNDEEYISASPTTKQLVCFEYVAEITQMTGNMYFRVRKSTTDICEWAIGSDGNGIIRNSQGVNQSTTGVGHFAVGDIITIRITLRASDHKVFCEARKITGANGGTELNASFTEGTVVWSSGDALNTRIICSGTDAIRLYRMAIYDGTPLANIGQS